VPTVAGGEAKNPIDAFVAAGLAERQLAFNPEADPRTLIRRVSFDLVGLPPEPAEIDAFEAACVARGVDGPYRELVDRLLVSPHYGERWGRHWLDVARYAEDQAHTFAARNYPQGFRYRDWVVRALNADMPFDEFARVQIAGDQLEQSPTDQFDRRLALGFFALGPVYYNDAGCAFKASLDELDDRIDTLGRGFLGLTLACARCHDHKFDPLSQQDYYALAGVFRSSSYQETPLVPPEVVQQFEAGQKAIRESEERVNRWLDSQAVVQSEVQARQAGRFLQAVWQLSYPPAGQPAPNRGELAKTLGLPEFLIERWQNLVKGDQKGKHPALDRWFELQEKGAQLAVPAGQSVPVVVAQVADGVQAQIVGLLAEWTELNRLYAQRAEAVPEAERGQLPKPTLEGPRGELFKTLATPGGACGVPRDKVEGLLADPEKQHLAELRKQVNETKQAAPAKYPYAHSLTDGQVANMKVHIRGNPNRTGAEVPRRFLEILGFVREQPFERVIANRVWQQHFGTGLVSTPNDFGVMGGAPSHPELLDYLAAWLRDHNGSLKQLRQLLLTSETYRQACTHQTAAAAKDADNRLLWRANRKRLDAETVRDAALLAAGRLDLTLYGPPVKHYLESPGVHVTPNANYLAFNPDAPGANRRSLYRFLFRTRPDPFLEALDCPDASQSTPVRPESASPLQALALWNNALMLKTAEHLAQRAKKITPDDVGSVAAACDLLLLRQPTPAESATWTAHARKHGLPSLCRVLMNTSEFLYVD